MLWKFANNEHKF